ncbi:MAG TPA: CPBP family intramembrane glutamic endopeptidase [Micromonosporaceae bacterium]
MATSRRRQTIAEIWIVLGLSLGQSAIYAILDLYASLTAKGGLAHATATLNQSVTPNRPYLDLAYQLLGIFFALISVALVWHLLGRDYDDVGSLLGINFKRPVSDPVVGVGLAAMIGIPGLGLYLLARALGLAVKVVPSGLEHVWWAVPVLVLSAIQNAIGEEVIVVGYLTTRLSELGFKEIPMIVLSATLRGSYHLYQGFGAFVGNFVMGLIFAAFYRRFGRVLPLIIAHSILDTVTFVGYDLFAAHLGFLH